jgi:uncharacterized membrane protein
MKSKIKSFFGKEKVFQIAGVAFLVCATLFLLHIPGPKILVESPAGKNSAVARVLDVDNSDIDVHGLVEYGAQHLTVELLKDKRKFSAENELRAQLEFDKKFEKGDLVLVNLPKSGDEGTTIIAREHYRLLWIGVLVVGFSIFLIAFAGWTGFRALFTFFFSCLAIWKILVPAVLAGYSATWTSFAAVAVLTAVIVFLVAGGLNKKGLCAFTGSMLGVLVSLALAEFFTRMLRLNGATMPFSQQLLYSGAQITSLQDIFTGAIILASSGAVMDLAMDISVGMEEIKFHKPTITFKEILFSGLRIGRAVVGTMTTTLLLAYSGGYLTMLMVFAVEGVSPLDFINTTIVSAEVVKTLVGSFGLVLVAPLTAAVGAVIYSRKAAHS